MGLAGQPLVSVLTPVYNGEKYLSECIDSVRAQTYENWEYVIVNNCSTDGTLEIAKSYASLDERIRIQSNDEFLPLMGNWNHAIRQISSKSKYCKVIHADDWLFPECLAQMVKLAEENSTVGIVASYRLTRDRVSPRGLRYPSTVIPGRDACRLYMLENVPLFGSPSTLLLRSDLVRSRVSFYNESNLHADAEACFNVLQESDFGFVHQVLTYTRLHEGSVTSAYEILNTGRLGKLHISMKYGPQILSPDEYQRHSKEKWGQYHRFLAKSVFRAEHKEILNYHRTTIRRLGHQEHSLSRFRLTKDVCRLAIDQITGPMSSIGSAFAKLFWKRLGNRSRTHHPNSL